MEPARDTIFHRYREGNFIETAETIISESFVELWLEDMQLVKFTCSPGFEKELGLGYLITSGLVQKKDHIERISFETNRLNITSTKKTDLVRRFLLAQADESQSLFPLEPLEDMLLAVSDLKALVRSFLSAQSLHSRTGGAHGAMIYDTNASQSVMVEDIGRLNAVDKVVGLAVQQDYSLSKSILLVSGRLTSEMVSKAIRARVSVMGSLAVATDIGVHLAMNNHLTLLGRLKDENFWLYNQGYAKIQS